MKNTFVKVLSMMIALMMVVGMFTSLPVFAAGCTHEGTTLCYHTLIMCLWRQLTKS